MSDITIWGRRSSFNVQKVLWVLDTLQLRYRHVEVGGRFGGIDTHEFASINPHQKVPVLQDGDLTVWESHAIIRYLAAQYSPSALWREMPSDRSYIDRWIDWSATRLQPDFMALFWGFYRTPKEERDETAIQQSREKCARDYNLLDSHLRSSDFLCGERLTLADIPIGATLHRYFTMGVDVPRPANVVNLYKRLSGMEAYRRHVMIPYEELFGRSVF